MYKNHIRHTLLSTVFWYVDMSGGELLTLLKKKFAGLIHIGTDLSSFLLACRNNCSFTLLEEKKVATFSVSHFFGSPRYRLPVEQHSQYDLSVEFDFMWVPFFFFLPRSINWLDSDAVSPILTASFPPSLLVCHDPVTETRQRIMEEAPSHHGPIDSIGSLLV